MNTKKHLASLFRVPGLDRKPHQIVDYLDYDPNTLNYREMEIVKVITSKSTQKEKK